jgi:hypothetical protein
LEVKIAPWSVVDAYNGYKEAENKMERWRVFRLGVADFHLFDKE